MTELKPFFYKDMHSHAAALIQIQTVKRQSQSIQANSRPDFMLWTKMCQKEGRHKSTSVDASWCLTCTRTHRHTHSHMLTWEELTNNPGPTLPLMLQQVCVCMHACLCVYLQNTSFANCRMCYHKFEERVNETWRYEEHLHLLQQFDLMFLQKCHVSDTEEIDNTFRKKNRWLHNACNKEQEEGIYVVYIYIYFI